MRQSLGAIVNLLAPELGPVDIFEVCWWKFSIDHTSQVRTLLRKHYRPATGNKMLAALKGVLKECWRQGRMSSEQYPRAVDTPAIQGQRSGAARALTEAEIQRLPAVCAGEGKMADIHQDSPDRVL